MNDIIELYFPILLMLIMQYQRYLNNIYINNCLIIASLAKGKRSDREGIKYCRLRGVSEDVGHILNGNIDITREHLRLEPRSFRKIIELMPMKRSGWDKEIELTAFLYWMASGCSYRVAAGFMGISKYTIRDIVHKMLDFFSIHLRHLIRRRKLDEFEQISDKFCRRAKTDIFAHAIGAIDGTHIRIACPVNKHDEYINYKSFYSIQCQAVVDSNHIFNSVFVGFPGSVHDTRGFKNSPLYKSGEYPPPNYYLLGDSGYPCRLEPVAVITPFKNGNLNQKKFNTAHSRARNVVECAFGMLKVRWRNIFDKALGLKIKNSIKTIFCACILHNICIEGGDFGPESKNIENWAEFAKDMNFTEFMPGEISDSNDAIVLRNSLLELYLKTPN